MIEKVIVRTRDEISNYKKNIYTSHKWQNLGFQGSVLLQKRTGLE